MSNVEVGLDRLERLARDAADAIKPRLPSVTREEYCRFLNMMYHYTHFSGENLARAAEISRSTEAREFFTHMSIEERGHHLLAEADLKALGYAVNPAMPAVVKRLNDYWNSIDADHYPALIGAIVLFENIASHAAPEVSALVAKLKLGRDSCRWLLTHVQADELHGADSLQLAKKYLAGEGAGTLLAGAERASRLWVDVFRAAFDEPVTLQPL